jgi:hypothetical protein
VVVKTNQKCKNDLPFDSDDESNLWLSFNEERSVLLGFSLGGDHGVISSSVLIVVLLSVSSSKCSSSSSILLSGNSGILKCFKYLSVSFLLLKNVFWDNPGSKLQKINIVIGKTYPFFAIINA